MLDLPKKDDTVNYEGLVPEIEAAGPVLADYFTQKGLQALVTSAKDGQHSIHSAHYTGRALDLRSWGIKSYGTFCIGLANDLNLAQIGGVFYVIWEASHVHVEWAGVGEIPNIVGYRPGKTYYNATANSSSAA